MKVKKTSWVTWVCFSLVIVCALAAALLVESRLSAASPPSGSVSPDSPSLKWSGGPFAAANPVGCFSVSGIDPTCDRFSLTIVPPKSKDYVVRVRVSAATASDPAIGHDDLDLFVRNPNNQTIATSGTSGGVEEVLLFNPPGGTYTVIVQPFLVIPGATYTGVASIGDAAHDEFSGSYNGTVFTPEFIGEPQSRPARSAPLVPQLKVSFNYVGRQAAEPTLGINSNNTVFYAAAAFDFPTPNSPRRLARTVVLRSRDKGATWQSVQAFTLSAESLDEPPFTLDPMIHVDQDAGNINPTTGRRLGRIFSIDLNLACGANTVFSDDDGETWTTIPAFACSQPVNDHHTIVTAKPSPPGAPGLTTTGYPNLLYFCFNRVADSSCNRSTNGGLTFTPSGSPAFVGDEGPALCGGLTGHLAADSSGRIFLPKGHCGLPWVARSNDGGQNWERFRIAGHTPMNDHEVSLAVDTADNIYAVWQGNFRLPYLSVSRDGGQTWSTPIMFAPPGVHEANFPTIIAGDAGRIAILFPGSKSRDFSDLTRPWDLYVVMSVNALDPNPVFLWTIANPANDPVHRGHCGPGRCDALGDGGGSMFDFLDIQTSPADGAFWGTASDTCIGACVNNPQPANLRPGEGVAIRQLKGPSLFVSAPR
jgi:hypothetical protein